MTFTSMIEHLTTKAPRSINQPPKHINKPKFYCTDDGEAELLSDNIIEVAENESKELINNISSNIIMKANNMFAFLKFCN